MIAPGPRVKQLAPFNTGLTVLVEDWDPERIVRPLPKRPSNLRDPDAGITSYLPTSMRKMYKAPLHSTSVRHYQRCPRYFLFNDRLGLRLGGDYAPALQIGTVFHRMMELSFRGYGVDSARATTLQEARAQLLKDIDGVVNSLGLLPDGSTPAALLEKAERDCMLGVTMAQVFLERYPIDPEKYEVIGSEVPVVARLAGDSHHYIQGKLDLVLRARATGTLFLWDYKTTSKLPCDSLDGVMVDVQPVMYRLLAEAQYKQAIRGFVHCIVQKPSIKYSPDTLDKLATDGDIPEAIRVKLESGKPLTENQQESLTTWRERIERDKGFKNPFEKYLARVREWYHTREKEADEHGADAITGNTKHPVLRSVIRFEGAPDGDAINLIRHVAKATNQRLHLRTYPKCGNMYTCLGTAGGSRCQYLPLCRTDRTPELFWPTILGQYYVQSHRDEEALEKED